MCGPMHNMLNALIEDTFIRYWVALAACVPKAGAAEEPPPTPRSWGLASGIALISLGLAGYDGLWVLLGLAPAAFGGWLIYGLVA